MIPAAAAKKKVSDELKSVLARRKRAKRRAKKVQSGVLRWIGGILYAEARYLAPIRVTGAPEIPKPGKTAIGLAAEPRSGSVNTGRGYPTPPRRYSPFTYCR